MKNYEFKRSFNDELINNLLKSDLYINKIAQDIRTGDVFPAVRADRMDFYHNGSKLFTFDRDGFKTHIKFASVYMSEDDYISESKLKDLKPIANFIDGYDRIKENCSMYSGVESDGVSSIYKKHSYVASKSEYVVLDIEVSLKSNDQDKKQDRIDILILDKNKKTLILCEAKHYSNKEIWSQKGTSPEVVEQVQRYEKQIISKGVFILPAYKRYIDAVNKLFCLTLPHPLTINPHVILLVFGFDRDQLHGRFAELFTSNAKELICYPIGNVASIKLDNMINKCKL